MCDQGRTGHTTRPLDTPQFQKKQNIVMGDILKKISKIALWKKAKNKTLGCRAFKELIITTPSCYYSLTFITVWITVKPFVYSELVLIKFLPWNRVLHYLSRTWSLKQCLCFPSHQGSQMYGKNSYLNRICKFLTFIRISFLVTL